MTRLDLSDPFVLEMADQTHRPEEADLVVAGVRQVDCKQCHGGWPCPTRQQVQEFVRAQSAHKAQAFEAFVRGDAT